MKDFLYKFFKERSLLLAILTGLEIILSIVCILSFVYSDTLSYSDSEIFTALGVETLLESIYSSTWWALILLLLASIAIFSLTSLIYKKLDYLFLAICSWAVMMILAINLNNSLVDNLAVLAIFIPIIIINIIAYFSQKEKQKELLKPKRKPRKKASAN